MRHWLTAPLFIFIACCSLPNKVACQPVRNRRYGQMPRLHLKSASSHRSWWGRCATDATQRRALHMQRATTRPLSATRQSVRHWPTSYLLCFLPMSQPCQDRLSVTPRPQRGLVRQRACSSSCTARVLNTSRPGTTRLHLERFRMSCFVMCSVAADGRGNVQRHVQPAAARPRHRARRRAA